MSSSPECKSCGDYIHGGLVICEGCISKRLTTARESAAREMREGCLEELRGELMVAQSCLAASGRINNTEYVNGWEARIMALHEAIKAIAALPLTPTKEPADG